MPRLAKVRDFLTSRWLVKLAFLAFFVGACVELLRFLAWTRGAGPYVSRPEVVGGLLPVGHFMSFLTWLRGGGWDQLLPAGVVIILGALATSLAFKRGFCGWICPVGTVWEGFSWLGKRIGHGRQIHVPRWLDWTGRGFRWAFMAACLGILAVVPLDEAIAFRSMPFMWVADIKILTLMLAPLYLLVVAIAGVISMGFGAVWCRYLCPVGGLYALVGEASPCLVHRDEDLCTHCGRCARVCHAFVDVDKRGTVRDTECDGCMECVRSCPTPGALEARAAGRLRIAPWMWVVLVVALWLGVFSAAKLTGNWDTRVTPAQFRAAANSGVLDAPSAPSSGGGQ